MENIGSVVTMKREKRVCGDFKSNISFVVTRQREP